jgi:drug/metabolite transporter (DMT)-like permease
MLAATFFFALMNVCIKRISHIPAMETVFFRCFISMLCCFAIIGYQGLNWKGSNRSLLVARGVAGTTAVYTFFVTIQHMPLASAVTIQYTSPIFTTLIAAYILKEQVRLFQYLCFAISFIGVLLIKGFDTSINSWYLILGVFSALSSGIAYNLVRSLKEKEETIVIVLHFQLVGLDISATDWCADPAGSDPPDQSIADRASGHHVQPQLSGHLLCSYIWYIILQ